MQEKNSVRYRGEIANPGRDRFDKATLADTRLSQKDAQTVVNWMKNPQSFLIYQGCPGAGKTHFCHAVISEVKESQYIRHKALWTESSFVARLKSGFNMSGSTEDAISYMFDDDLVVFDDLGSTKRGDWKEDIILQFVDYRYKIRKPTVITSNLSEIEIKEQLGFRVHSRLFDKENTILDFGKIDWRLVDIDQRP